MPARENTRITRSIREVWLSPDLPPPSDPAKRKNFQLTPPHYARTFRSLGCTRKTFSLILRVLVSWHAPSDEETMRQMHHDMLMKCLALMFFALLLLIMKTEGRSGPAFPAPSISLTLGR